MGLITASVRGLQTGAIRLRAPDGENGVLALQRTHIGSSHGVDLWRAPVHRTAFAERLLL